MDQLIILASIALRLVGVGYSVWLLYRVEDARFGFLTLMLGLMATRQILTYQAGPSGVDELPGLVVSVLAVLTVYYLAQYTEQEAQVKRTIEAKNERLRTFQKAIEHAGHAIFITDPDATITYANQAVESVTGYTRGEVLGKDPAMWKSDFHDEAFYAEMWETIESGEIWDGQIVNERKDGTPCWVDMTIAPIVGESGHVEKYVAVDTDITDRKERKRRITDQRNRLEVLNRTNEVLRDVNRELVEADSREEIETAVIERFAASDQFDFACLATARPTGEGVRPRAWAGIDGDELDEMLGAIETGPGTDPLSRSVGTGEVEIGTCSDPDAEWCAPWRDRAFERVGAIPLSYGETGYGTLCIGTRTEEAFEDIETAVFRELGETIGYAINAVESKEALLTDSVTEIELLVGDPSCYSVALSRELDAELELRWVTAGAGESLIEYVTVSGADPEAVSAFAADCEAIGDARLVTEDDGESLYRFEVTDSCVAEPLVDYGGDLRSIVASDGTATITAHLSRSADVRSVLSALQNDLEDVSLRARREIERPALTTGEIRSAMESALTDRQREALQTAFVGGFFEWPRDSSGEEIAAVMGINQSTFLQHLRAAERKVLEVLLGSDRPVAMASLAQS
jgi:PAS domain S-box-containing protein